eukprot:134163-Chlamydomonas_euryale.AAC.1
MRVCVCVCVCEWRVREWAERWQGAVATARSCGDGEELWRRRGAVATASGAVGAHGWSSSEARLPVTRHTADPLPP